MVTTYELRGSSVQFSITDDEIKPLNVPSIRDILVDRGVPFVDNTEDYLGLYQEKIQSKSESSNLHMM